MNDQELDKLIRLHSSKLRAYVNHRVRGREDAEDIIQDTWLQFIQSLRILENPIGHVTSWLYTVAHNLIINQSKKKREVELPTYSDGDDEYFMVDLTEIMVENADSPDMQMLRAMIWKELDKALEELPKEQRQAIHLTEVEGLSTVEAAERMHVSQATFLSRKHYAVMHIRKRLRTLYNELIGKS